MVRRFRRFRQGTRPFNENELKLSRSTTMPRIPYPDPATLPEAMRRVVLENPSNVTRMLAAASEPVFKGFVAMSMGFMGGGSRPPPALREIALPRGGPR